MQKQLINIINKDRDIYEICKSLASENTSSENSRDQAVVTLLCTSAQLKLGTLIKVILCYLTDLCIMLCSYYVNKDNMVCDCIPFSYGETAIMGAMNKR